MLHDASNGVCVQSLKKIGQLSIVKGPPVMFRVENFE